MRDVLILFPSGRIPTIVIHYCSGGRKGLGSEPWTCQLFSFNIINSFHSKSKSLSISNDKSSHDQKSI